MQPRFTAALLGLDRGGALLETTDAPGKPNVHTVPEW